MPGKLWPQWNLLDDGLLPLAGALMWSAWTALLTGGVLHLAAADQTTGGAGEIAFALLWSSTLAAKIARRSPRGRWLVALGGLLAVAIAEWWLLYRGARLVWDWRWLAMLADQVGGLSAGPLVVIVMAAFLWWRGTTADWTSHDELAGGFMIGVIVLGLTLALSTSWGPQFAAGLPPAAALFLVAAWGALSLAGVRAATRSTPAEASALKLNRYWLLAVLAVVGGIFGVGLLLAGLAAPRGMAGLIAALQPVRQTVEAGLLFIFIALVYVVFLVLTPLIWLWRLLVQRSQPQPLQPPPPLTDLLGDSPSSAAALSPAAGLALRGLWVGGLLLVIGLLFAWALRRWASTDDEGVRESRELIGSWELIRAQLAGLLARRRRAKPPALFGPLAGEPNDPSVWIRAAYRQVLALAVEQGRPRPPAQTSLDYLPTLVALWPEEGALLESLTRAYTAARYGRLPPSGEQIEEIRRGLERMKIFSWKQR